MFLRFSPSVFLGRTAWLSHESRIRDTKEGGGEIFHRIRVDKKLSFDIASGECYNQEKRKGDEQ